LKIKIVHLKKGVENFKYLGVTPNEDKGKGKAIQLQALTGPGGSRRLRRPDFKTIGT
jgi:hypothetical protein